MILAALTALTLAFGGWHPQPYDHAPAPTSCVTIRVYDYQPFTHTMLFSWCSHRWQNAE